MSILSVMAFFSKAGNNLDWTSIQPPVDRTKRHLTNMKITHFILGAAFAASAMSAAAQGIIASGDVVGSAAGSDFDYTLSITDGSGATSGIGSFWYAWTPGNEFMPTTPLSAFAPSGWTATVSGGSIQFIAGPSTPDVAPGSTLSGFGFTSTSSPAQLAGNDGLTPIGTTVAYAGNLFVNPSDTFVFNTTATPEPSSLMLMGVGAFGMLMRRFKK